MKDLTKVFIDLSKLSEEELRIVRMTLYKNREYVPFFTNLFEIDHYYKLHYYKGDWLCGDTWYNEKTELAYPEFIKLFEGGEAENNGWIKIDDDNDYPHKYGHYFFRWECAQGKEHIEIYNVDNRGINCPPSATITHYQPIIKPEPPKF